MQIDKFKGLMLDTFVETEKLLIGKGKEYSSKDNVFENFDKGVARARRMSREDVLMGYKLKHDISVEDMVYRNPSDPTLRKEYINEKINDSIAYLVLLKAMLLEREGHISDLPF